MKSPEQVVRAIAASKGVNPDLAVSIWQQESGRSTNTGLRGETLSRGRGAAVGPWQVVPHYHPDFPVSGSFEDQTRYALDYLKEVGPARYYGTGKAPAGHPTSEQYVNQVMNRVPGSGHNIPASAITGDPSAYSGGSIMPVSAIPQGTLMPDAQQQTQQPQGLLGNLDPALGGLIGLSMLAGSFGGGQQGGMGGALASLMPLLMPQQGNAPAAPKMGTTTIKRGDEEVTFLTKDGVPVQEIGTAPRWQPPGAADNTTAAQKNFEYLRDVVKLPPGEAADRAFKTGVTVNTGDSAAPVAAPEGGSWTDFKKGEYVVQTPGGPKIRKVPMEQAATEGEATKAAQLGVARDMVSRMQELRAEGVSVGGLKGVGEEWRSRPGALNAMADWASGKFGFPRESGVTEMLTLSSRLEKELIAAMRGASVGPEEEKAFRVTLPVPSQPDDIFDANLDLTLRNIDELARRKEEARSGDTTPDLTPTDDDMQEILDLIP